MGLWTTPANIFVTITANVLFIASRYVAPIAAVVIILCFLLTSTTSFEYMLESREMYIDTRTGLPCNGTRTILTMEANSSFSSSSSTPAMDLSEHYNDTAFELEPMKQLLEDRNYTRPSLSFDQTEASFCVKVSDTIIMLHFNKKCHTRRSKRRIFMKLLVKLVPDIFC